MYTKQTLEDGQVLTAAHLNHIEEGLENAAERHAGSGAPTTATVASVGELYMDTNTGNLYKCIAVKDSVYTWVAVAEGGGGSSTAPTLENPQAWLGEHIYEKDKITEVRFVTHYEPIAYDDTWDAGLNAGDITCYREGSIITVSSNGSPKIRLNGSANNFFGGASLLKSVSGLDMIDVSMVTAMAGLFAQTAVYEVDLSNWCGDAVTSINGMFNSCPNLRSVKLPYSMRSLTQNANSLFGGSSKLEHVDIGGLRVLTESMFASNVCLKTFRCNAGIKTIPNKMFAKCINLEVVEGLSEVESIGDMAFVYNASLKKIDINPSILTKIGASAFRLSNMENVINMDELNTACEVGTQATRTMRWFDTKELGKIQDKALPTILLRVPHADSQQKYSDVHFCFAEYPFSGDTVQEVSIAMGGCFAFALYHEWQCNYKGTENEKLNFLDFWKMFEDAGFVKTNDEERTDPNGDVFKVVEDFGWTEQIVYVSDKDAANCQNGAAALDTIINRLNEGKPTHVIMYSASIAGGMHCVVIVGADTATGKLAVLDSNISTSPHWVWVKFEDIFTQTNDFDRLFIHDVTKEG